MDELIAGTGLTREFDTPGERVLAVRDVSLSLRAGEFVCLMGPSGCGKSTLLGLLSGLDVPTAGRVVFGETELSALTAERRAAVRLREFGMVFQEHNLIPEFTACDNVMLPLEAVGTDEKSARRAAEAAMERVGIGELHGRFPAELSGGQRQRVGIARATVGGRTVLFADEATGALDRANTMVVFALFRALADQGYAVLAATHDAAGSQLADRTVHMEDGAISTVDVRA